MEKRKESIKRKIAKSEWAKRFKKECPSSYDRAVEIATEAVVDSDDYTFLVYPTNDISLDETRWVIDYDGFWMDDYASEKEAIDLCNLMGWSYEIRS